MGLRKGKGNEAMMKRPSESLLATRVTSTQVLEFS